MNQANGTSTHRLKSVTTSSPSGPKSILSNCTKHGKFLNLKLLRTQRIFEYNESRQRQQKIEDFEYMAGIRDKFCEVKN